MAMAPDEALVDQIGNPNFKMVLFRETGKANKSKTPIFRWHQQSELKGAWDRLVWDAVLRIWIWVLRYALEFRISCFEFTCPGQRVPL